MTRLPVIDAKTLERVLLSIGFVKTRQKGSHAFYRHPDGRVTTIPHHSGRDLGKPLIHQILRNIHLSTDEFIELLKS